MTAEERLTGVIGLCVRARQAVFGEDSCVKTLRAGGSTLLLLDGEASGNTRKKYEETCRRAGAELWMLPRGLLGAATGKPGVAMAVLEGSLAKQVVLRLTEVPEGVEKVNLSANNGGGARVEWRK